MLIASFEENPGKSAAKAGLIGVHRGLAFGVKRTSGKFVDGFTWSELHELVSSDPFGFLADFNDRSPWNVALAEDEDKTWLSNFQHRMIILVSSFATDSTEPTSNLQANPRLTLAFITNALSQVRKFVEEVIRVSHPEEATTILEKYLPKFLKLVGMEGDGSEGW